ncbi:MAG TPA: chemotaxis protein CheB [Thermoanaerobaculia bacterium]|nr:chemotaxis protein CheB [Thermoanaerobaculia bacterium]
MALDLVVVGASLGGLAALQALLAGLPDGFAVPIAVAQHRRPDAESRLTALLGRKTSLAVREPDDKEPIEPGTVYVAPADYHLLVEGEGTFALSVDGPVTFARPSIDVLFESAAEAYGQRLAAVLLTASSDDGAAGIAAVAAHGGVTVVEDPETAASPVAGRAAMARTAVAHVLPVGEIGALLGELAKPAAAERRARR